MRYCIFLVMLLLSQSGIAEVYTWVDERGVKHFSDRPVGNSHQEIELEQIQTYNTGGEQRRLQQNRLSEVLEHERMQRQKAEGERLAKKKERELQCIRSRNQLKNYREVAYLYEEDELGRRRILSTEEHKKAIEEARGLVAHWCEKK